MNEFSIFSFEKIINKIWIIKFEILCNVQMKYGLNKIKIKLFTQQMGWLGGKGASSLKSKDQISQMTCIVFNIGILIKYSIPT
jgi:hypothetical protein